MTAGEATITASASPVLGGLPVAVDGPGARHHAAGGDRPQPQRRPLRRSQQLDGVAAKGLGIRRVEDLHPRPLEAREIAEERQIELLAGEEAREAAAHVADGRVRGGMPGQVPVRDRPELVLAEEGQDPGEVLAKHVHETHPVHVRVDLEARRRPELGSIAHRVEQTAVARAGSLARAERGAESRGEVELQLTQG